MPQEPTLEFYSKIHTDVEVDGQEAVTYAELRLTKADAKALSTLAVIARTALSKRGQAAEAIAASLVGDHFANVYWALHEAGAK